jgi:hypothetical protein
MRKEVTFTCGIHPAHRTRSCIPHIALGFLQSELGVSVTLFRCIFLLQSYKKNSPQWQNVIILTSLVIFYGPW